VRKEDKPMKPVVTVRNGVIYSVPDDCILIDLDDSKFCPWCGSFHTTYNGTCELENTDLGSIVFEEYECIDCGNKFYIEER
jgi:hypothetical protein